MKTRIFTLIMSLFIATMAFAEDVAEIDGIYYYFDHENKTAEVIYGDNFLVILLSQKK